MGRIILKNHGFFSCTVEALGENHLIYALYIFISISFLSQRIPHVALTGKAFMLMPNGQTLLEHKLNAYK
jgi:hypothetical protein